MIFAIDGIFMSNAQPGGYRTYTNNLVRHLRLIDDVNRYLLIVDREIPWEPQANWRVMVKERRGRCGFVWREQISLPKSAQSEGANLLHCPGATGPLRSSAPVVVTIYDTIEFSQPLPSPQRVRRWAMRVYSRYVQRAVARSAAAVITISNYSRNQVSQCFDIAANQIHAIHLAPPEIFYAMDATIVEDQVSSHFGVKDYILAIASAVPRKNIPTLLQAYALLEPSLRQKHHLVLVCTHQAAKNGLLKLASSLDIADNVTFLEQVSDNNLALLYNAARLFVFPSLEEGFGLPPLEAMTCGTPVIASNTSSMPEVLGDAALLIPPRNLQELSEAMTSVLTNADLATELRDHGLQRSREFSWENTARETLRVYEEVARA